MATDHAGRFPFLEPGKHGSVRQGSQFPLGIPFTNHAQSVVIIPSFSQRPLRVIGVVVKNKFLALLVISASSICAAQADQLRLPEESGREAPRDMNIFQVEPTILDEQYYVSGKCERHQFVGNTLPVDAPIPDTEGPMPLSSITIKPSVSLAPSTMLPSVQEAQPPVVPASAH